MYIKVNPKVNYSYGVIMMCQCGIINVTNIALRLQDIAETVHMWGQACVGTGNFCTFQFCYGPKTL